MSRQKYTHIQVKEEEILALREAGATRQEIANQLGLSKVQIKNWINRYNRKQTKLEAGVFPKPKGRRRKVSASQNSVLDNRKGPAKAGPLDYSCSKQLRM